MQNVFYIINRQIGHLARRRHSLCLAETVILGAVNSGQLDMGLVFVMLSGKLYNS